MPFPQPQQLPKAPQTMGRRAEKTAREPFQEPLLLLLPSVSAPPSLLPREPPKTGIGGVEVGQGSAGLTVPSGSPISSTSLCRVVSKLSRL